MSARDAMISELKRIVQPSLRSMGFSGSFPHYRKIASSSIDLVTFQFSRYGGSFVVEAARCPPTGFVTHGGKHIPPAKVKAHDLPIRKRLRPSSAQQDTSDYWFEFDDHQLAQVAETVKGVLEQPAIWASVPETKATGS